MSHLVLCRAAALTQSLLLSEIFLSSPFSLDSEIVLGSATSHSHVDVHTCLVTFCSAKGGPSLYRGMLYACCYFHRLLHGGQPAPLSALLLSGLHQDMTARLQLSS